MSLDEIKALPVDDITAKDAHLYLWVPNALLPEGIEVMQAWGFRYVSNIVWAKRRKDGGPDGRGVGFYFRNVTELLLFGVKGHMRTLDAGRRQVNMIETRNATLAKPDEQYDLITSCSPGPTWKCLPAIPSHIGQLGAMRQTNPLLRKARCTRATRRGDREHAPAGEPRTAD